jgi:hypothetical protein
MPVEIKELVIKATVAIDWENKTVTETGDDIVCLRLPNQKVITNYVSQYFNQERAKTLSFDQATLAVFLAEWQTSLLK